MNNKTIIEFGFRTTAVFFAWLCVTIYLNIMYRRLDCIYPLGKFRLIHHHSFPHDSVNFSLHLDCKTVGFFHKMPASTINYVSIDDANRLHY